MDKSTLTKFNKDKYINNSFMNTLTHRFTAKNIGSKKNTSKDKNGQMKGIFS